MAGARFGAVRCSSQIRALPEAELALEWRRRRYPAGAGWSWRRQVSRLKRHLYEMPLVRVCAILAGNIAIHDYRELGASSKSVFTLIRSFVGPLGEAVSGGGAWRRFFYSGTYILILGTIFCLG